MKLRYLLGAYQYSRQSLYFLNEKSILRLFPFRLLKLIIVWNHCLLQFSYQLLFLEAELNSPAIYLFQHSIVLRGREMPQIINLGFLNKSPNVISQNYHL